MDVEQSNEEQQTTDASDDVASRDDLIAAAREAGGAASVDVQAEAAAAAKSAAAGGEPAAGGEQAGEEEPRIAQVLRAREKANAEREAARNHAQEMMEQARQESDRILREAREQAQREAEAERERLRAEFRVSPTATLRQLGTPQEISDAVMRDGTPEGRAIQQLQHELAETKKKAGGVDDVRRQFDAFKQEQAQQAEAVMIADARARFLATASKDSAPHLHARYDEDEIFDKGNQVAANWKRGGLRLVPLGSPKSESDFDFSDVAKYLDGEAKKRFAASGLTPAQQVSAGAPAKEPGNAPKVSANGSRTLSAAQGSERRTSPKPVAEMSASEERQALIDAVAEARRANPGSTT